MTMTGHIKLTPKEESILSQKADRSLSDLCLTTWPLVLKLHACVETESFFSFFFKKIPPYTLAGIDLTIYSSASRALTTIPRPSRRARATVFIP
jgi:hypothetical protein